MDDEAEETDVEHRVRALLVPDEAVVRRVITRALQPRRRPHRMILLIVMFLILTIAALMNRSGWRSRPESSASVSITAQGSFLIVHRDGRRWLVGHAPERRAGGNYVIVVPE